jgi:transposase
MAAAPWIVSDELWEPVEPLLPRKERRFRGATRSLRRLLRGGCGLPSATFAGARWFQTI